MDLSFDGTTRSLSGPANRRISAFTGRELQRALGFAIELLVGAPDAARAEISALVLTRIDNAWAWHIFFSAEAIDSLSKKTQVKISISEVFCELAQNYP